MTEREHELLETMLTTPVHDPPPMVLDERSLLRAAEALGPVSLAAPTHSQHTSFANDLAALARRYPFQMAFAAAGVAFLLARSRR